MRAKVKVTGTVRIFRDGDSKRIGEIQPTEEPHEETLEGAWGVGSGSVPPEHAAGSVEVTALEDGNLRVYEEAKDPSTGSVTNSVESHYEALKAAETKTYATHESNAYTVQAVSENEVRRDPKPRKDEPGKAEEITAKPGTRVEPKPAARPTLGKRDIA